MGREAEGGSIQRQLVIKVEVPLKFCNPRLKWTAVNRTYSSKLLSHIEIQWRIQTYTDLCSPTSSHV